MADALNGIGVELFDPYFTGSVTVFRAYLALKKEVVELSNTAEAGFVEVGKFGNASGGSSGGGGGTAGAISLHTALFSGQVGHWTGSIVQNTPATVQYLSTDAAPYTARVTVEVRNNSGTGQGGSVDFTVADNAWLPTPVSGDQTLVHGHFSGGVGGDPNWRAQPSELLGGYLAVFLNGLGFTVYTRTESTSPTNFYFTGQATVTYQTNTPPP
jgi:hypothetical protein